MLACLCRRRRAELRADFRRYYGLDFDTYSRERPTVAADLAAMLPRESATVRREYPEAEWGWQEHMLASVDYGIKAIAHGIGATRGKPRQIKPPKATRAASASDMQAVAQALGIAERVADTDE